jgi:hypothetical protein
MGAGAVLGIALAFGAAGLLFIGLWKMLLDVVGL